MWGDANWVLSTFSNVQEQSIILPEREMGWWEFAALCLLVIVVIALGLFGDHLPFMRDRGADHDE